VERGRGERALTGRFVGARDGGRAGSHGKDADGQSIDIRARATESQVAQGQEGLHCRHDGYARSCAHWRLLWQGDLCTHPPSTPTSPRIGAFHVNV